MKTKKINLYSFDELLKDVQEKVIQKFREDDDLYFLSDDMQYKVNELLKENSIKGEAKVYYSLSYCQGDGAMFYGDFEYKGYNINIKHAGHYYHFNSKDITITDDEGNDIDGQFYEDFNTLYVDMCKELARYGYDYIETSQSDENITDMIQANDYYFTETGELTAE